MYVKTPRDHRRTHRRLDVTGASSSQLSMWTGRYSPYSFGWCHVLAKRGFGQLPGKTGKCDMNVHTGKETRMAHLVRFQGWGNGSSPREG